MGKLAEFANRVREQITLASHEPHWEPSEAARYMAEVAVRRESFTRLAANLAEKVIRPHLETLVAYFSNASPIQGERNVECSYWFGYCERFPASTKVSFAIEHDIPFDKAAICFEATMMPTFVKLNDRDRLTFPLDKVNEDEIADWVEERLLEFLQAYLRIDRGAEDFEEDAASDPVCGMRLSRSQAVSSHNYRGHSYFFCSKNCADRFNANPASFLQTTTDSNRET